MACGHVLQPISYLSIFLQARYYSRPCYGVSPVYDLFRAKKQILLIAPSTHHRIYFCGLSDLLHQPGSCTNGVPGSLHCGTSQCGFPKFRRYADRQCLVRKHFAVAMQSNGLQRNAHHLNSLLYRPLAILYQQLRF
ncbi:hypothetical protein D3C73_1083890 [compost metagenome]